METVKNIYYVGVDDRDIDLFEGQYVVPNGVSYNSYVIMDDKITVMDTVDVHKKDVWLNNLEKVLNGRVPEYIVVSHVEPDHSGSLEVFLEKYKNVKIVSNAKVFSMISQFFPELKMDDRKVVVNENDTLSLGSHVLKFILAPMVHWPEVMMTFEETEGILFSADAFGKFGTLDTVEKWDDEARRYYFNIVGKYGAQVQTLLKKVAVLDIKRIFPLHGPILNDNLNYYIGKYNLWSSYQPENNGILIAYASIYGNTKNVVDEITCLLRENKENVVLIDLAREDISRAVENAFRYDRLILASPTYDGGLFPAMENFILRLKSKNYQNRKVAFVENFSWAPMAAKKMKELMETMKNIEFVEDVVSIKSAIKSEDMMQIENLVNKIRL
ncbi:MAG: FprA family A-type flavoprotein [Rickettsiales bacterium]|nr:FprA family A-type flavoprotein [Rickettsiales bacterium]